MKTRRAVTCPRCKTSAIDTITTVPYIRGFVIAYNYGTKRLVGCNPCVKKQLAGEVGLSLLTGWFSITAFLVNPVCILWNSARLPFIKSDPAQVDRMLLELGIRNEQVDLPRVAAALAASMVAADGKVDPEEVVTAITTGTRLIDGLHAALFHEVLENVKRLPATSELAAMLADVLDDAGKVAVLEYLFAIAAADGTVDSSEIKHLEDAAAVWGVAVPEHSKLASPVA